MFRLLLLYILTLSVATVTAVPLVRSTRGSPKYHEVDLNSKNTGCYINITKTYNETKVEYDYINGVYISYVKEVTVTVRDCCPGYVGDDCDISVREDNPSCGNVTCPNYPNASCVTVSHCGQDVQLFLNQNHLIIKECIPKNLCLGACRNDPCKELECEEHPDALCFTDCNCSPLWVLPQGRKRVQCASSQKRSAGDSCMY